MEKKIIKGAIKALANAPAAAMWEYIRSLPPDERAEAIRLSTAIGIPLDERGESPTKKTKRP